MTVVVLGVDALDVDLVEPERHPNLALDEYRKIDTISSETGDPSTHELWPTIITGLPPEEHGIQLNDGVAWDNPLLRYGSNVADYLLPEELQSRIGAWLLTNTEADAFRLPASYYADNDISTVFDDRIAKPIGIPNYVVDEDATDREHELRQSLGDLFERDPDAVGGHTSSDPYDFYEVCMEMAMVRIARARRGLRGGRHELVFVYTSGLDLIGHVTYDLPELQRAAYEEIDEFVGDIRGDLDRDDELLLVSDHGLQNGVHTHDAMVAGTDPDLVDAIESVLDVRSALEAALADGRHDPGGTRGEELDHQTTDDDRGDEVRNRLEDLGYM